MCQDPKLFKDPQQFNPDRWATDDIHPFTMLPFGFGPRGCWGTYILSCTLKFNFYNVGRRFAEVQMKVFLCQVILLLSSLAVS